MAGIDLIIYLGAPGLRDKYGLDHTFAMRMLGLSGRGIHLSIGIAERVREGRKERIALDALFRNERLRTLGLKLTQEQLDQILRETLLETFKPSLIEKRVPETAPLSQITRALELDLELKVQVEEGFVIIATEDEISASKGALMVLERQTAVALSGNPGALLASDRGREILGEETERFQRELVSRTFRLPGTSDPAEFERELGFLTAYMRKGDSNHVLVEYATQNFASRPARSRRFIALTMINHGLDKDLMNNIGILSEEGKPVAQKKEAINALVATIPKLASTVEIMMATVTLIKLLEEEPNEEVKKHALTKMAEKAAEISRCLPNLIAEARIVPILKDTLLANPKAYRTSVERVLIAFGRLDAEAVITPIWEEFDTVTDPYVRLAYHNILEAVEQGADSLAEIRRSKWELYFEVRQTHPDIGEAVIAEFKTKRAESIDQVRPIFLVLDQGKQSHLVGLMDEVAVESLDRAAAQPQELVVAGKVATFFVELLEAETPDTVKLAMLKGKLVTAPTLTTHYQQQFWPHLAEYLRPLIADSVFVARFTDCGQNYLVLFVHQVEGTAEVVRKLALLKVAQAKFQKVDTQRPDFAEQREELENVLEGAFAQTFQLIKTPPPGICRRDLFRGLVALTRATVITPKVLIKQFGDMRKAIQGQEEAELLSVESTRDLASHPLLTKELGEGVRENLLAIIRKQADAFEESRPAVPSARTGLARIVISKAADSLSAEEVLEIALEGLHHLVANPHVGWTPNEQLTIINPLLTIAMRRPKNVTVYEKGKQQTVLPDFIRDKIIAVMEEMLSPAVVRHPQIQQGIRERITQMLDPRTDVTKT